MAGRDEAGFPFPVRKHSPARLAAERKDILHLSWEIRWFTELRFDGSTVPPAPAIDKAPAKPVRGNGAAGFCGPVTRRIAC